MRAVGFSRQSLQKIILSEHVVLLYSGLGIGALSSLLAVLPSLLTPGTHIPFAAIIFTFIAVFGSGLLWTWLATKLAMSGELLAALRNE